MTTVYRGRNTGLLLKDCEGRALDCGTAPGARGGFKISMGDASAEVGMLLTKDDTLLLIEAALNSLTPTPERRRLDQG
jgi:hypothetical protein